MKNLRASDIKPVTPADRILDQLLNRREPADELNEVPEEIMAEVEVRSAWPKLSAETKRKIINGEPF